MRFLVLGPLEVAGPDGTVPLGGRRQRAVLAALLVHRDRPLPTDRLVDLVWGAAPPPSASGTLQAYVSRLRGSLGADVIAFDGGGYTLAVPPDAVDLTCFEELVAVGDAAAAEHEHEAALRGYVEALGLWRGDRFLGELGEEPFALADAARLEGLRLHALEGRFAAALALDRGSAILPELEAAVRAHPYREGLSAQLMLALYRTGRQVEALACYRRTAHRLREEVGVEPGAELRELERRILAQDPSLEQRAIQLERQERAANPTNLRPFTTSFLGREVELARLEELIRSERMVTVTGPGGVGKTRLAVELGWRLLETAEGGVWDLDLASEADGGRLDRIFARALDVPERPGVAGLERVARAIGDRPVVFLLDNCEHLVTAARGAVDALLERCPRLRVVATSREPLGAADERILALEPLPLPADTSDAAALRASPAVRLFEERAAAVHPGFRLTTANAAAVVEIVRRVEGVPLAVELAASNVGLHTPQALAAMLAAGLPPLVAADPHDARHATLRSTIGWSYEQLTDVEQRLLDRIAVFAGPFTAAAAARVCAGEGVAAGEVPALLEGLVRRSLVGPPVPDGRDGQPRYRLLELIRRYALDHLDATGELGVRRQRHLDHVRGLAATAADAFHGPDQGRWYDRLRSENVEIERALATAVELGADRDLVELVRCLWLWWYLDARTDDALGWLERAIAVAEDDAVAAELLAASALVRAEAAGRDSTETAAAAGERALELATTVDRPDLLATVRLLVGDAMTLIDEYGRAEELLDAAVAHFHAHGPVWAEGWAVLRLVRVDGYAAADIERAQERLEAAIELLRQAGETQLLAYAELIRGNAARMHGDMHTALDRSREAVALYRRLAFEAPLGEALQIEADVLTALGRYDAAGGVLDEVAARAERAGSAIMRTVAETARGWLHAQRGALDEARSILEGELAERRANHDPMWVGAALWSLVPVLAWAGHTERAAELADELGRMPDDVPVWFRIRGGLAVAEARLAQGDRDAADAALRTVEGLARDVRQLHGLAAALEGRAAIAGMDGDARLAARHLGAASALRDASGARAPAPVADRSAAIVRWARRELGREGFAAAWGAGAGEPSIPLVAPAF